MPPTVTPLSARSHTFVAALLALIVVMGASPLVEIAAVRWPIRFGEVPWRFATFQLFLANGPQLIILIAVVAVFGVLIGNRLAVRAAAIVLGVMAVLTVLVLPFFLLDFLQMRRIVKQEVKGAFTLINLKAGLFAGLVALGAAWSALRGWQASEPSDAAARREKGAGLVVGQAGQERPPT